MIAAEEARAAAYRAQAVARTAARVALDAVLTGNPVLRAALEERWRPIKEYRRDAKQRPITEDDVSGPGDARAN